MLNTHRSKNPDKGPPLSSRIKAGLLLLSLLLVACTPSQDQGLLDAEEAYKEKDYAHAITLSDLYLQENSGSLDARFIKARAFVQRDHIKEALKMQEKFAQEAPKKARLLLREIAVSMLSLSLTHENYFVRSAAVKAIGEVGEPDLTALLIPSLRDSETFVRFFAIEAIGQLEGPDTLKLVMALSRDPDSMVRVAAVKVLTDMGPKGPGGVSINNLLGTFAQDSDVTVKLFSIAAQSLNGDLAAFQRLKTAISALSEDELASGVAALGRSQHAEAAPLLLSYLGRPKKMIRMFTAEAMGDNPHASFYEGLQKSLSDEEASVRGAAATSLGKLGDTKIIPALTPLLKDKSPMVRVAAAEGLKRLGVRHIKVYENALSDPDYGVRHFTIGSLKRNWDFNEAIPLLRAALIDQAPRVRTAAIRAIADLGGEESLALLKAMMKDRDQTVRLYAAGGVGRILNKISGKNLKALKGD